MLVSVSGVRLSLTVTIAIWTADLRGGNLAVQVRTEFDVGVAHAGVTVRLGASSTGNRRRGAGRGLLAAAGSSSDLAAEPGE